MAKTAPHRVKTLHRRAPAVFFAAALALLAARSPAVEPQKPDAPTPAAPAAQPSQEPTAEKEFKNIQVLTGMPASQLMPVMHFMRASLGVHCDFCHVAENGKYDLDTKKEKETARKMIRMVLAINRDNFEGRTQVACNTCHRGHEDPVRVPPIGQGQFADTTRSDLEPAPEKLPEAAEVLDHYIAALGGRAALEAVTSRVSRGTILRPTVVDPGTPKARAVNRGQELPLEILQQAPNKITVIVGPPAPQTVTFDGTAGSVKTAEGERPLGPREINRMAEQADLHRELTWRGQADKMKVTGRDEIDGRKVILLRTSAVDGSPKVLAFDAETGLLRRQIIYRPLILGADPEQTDYEDYRDVGGVKVPFVVKTSYLDDNHLGTTRKFTEVRNNAVAEERK